MAINIVLHEPEIPHNTGAIARTCVLTNSRLHLIKPFGFDLSDKYLKRAGLDFGSIWILKSTKTWMIFLKRIKMQTFI